MIITGTPTIEGHPIEQYLGVVHANIVIGTNIFSDFAASLTDVFGGNSDTYQGKMDKMLQQAEEQIVRKAIRLRANAVVAYRTDFSEISGKGKGMFMLSATGTACIVSLSQKEEQISARPTAVSSESLRTMVKTDRIVEKINGHKNLADEDWNIILDNPNTDILKALFAEDNISHYFQRERYLLLLQKNEPSIVQEVFYNAFSKTLHYYVAGNVYQPEVLNPVLAELAKACNIFNPCRISELFEQGMAEAAYLLDADMASYTKEDLPALQSLVEKIDNLPDKGKHEEGKLELFSKRSLLYICPNGHKNPSDTTVCSQCLLDIKGFNHNERMAIETFKAKVEKLKKLLG